VTAHNIEAVFKVQQREAQNELQTLNYLSSNLIKKHGTAQAKLTKTERQAIIETNLSKIEELERNMKLLNVVHSGLCELVFVYLSSLQCPVGEAHSPSSAVPAPAAYIFAILKALLQNVRINAKNLRIKPG
jgi:hypothetical protein